MAEIPYVITVMGTVKPHIYQVGFMISYAVSIESG